MWSLSSPSWHVALSAERLAVAKAAAFWPGKFGEFDAVELDSGTQSTSWQPAVAALAAWLASNVGRKPALHIVLSGRFVRWQLLPWRPEISRPDELATYAALRFRETFGQVVDSWEIMLSPQPPGKATLACAIDAALLDALRTTCRGSGAQLAAVSPYFAVAFDRWQHVLGKKTAWFGLVESDCVTLALLRDGDWVGLRTQRVDANGCAALPAMMAQIGICADVAVAALPLYLVGDAGNPVAIDGLAVTWLEPKELLNCASPGGRMALGC